MVVVVVAVVLVLAALEVLLCPFKHQSVLCRAGFTAMMFHSYTAAAA